MVSTITVKLNSSSSSGEAQLRFSAITGNNKINSTSKITKINATRKKCTEKKIRLEALELNPHSKGDSFSRSRLSFQDKM